jgi:hypothetical protein
MNLKFNIALIGLAFVLIQTACINPFNHKIRGNGNIQTEYRNFDETFDGIYLEDNFIVYTSHSTESLIEIVADDNLLPYIKTVVNNGELKITTVQHHTLKGTRDIVIYVKNPNLSTLNISGSGSIITDSLNSNNSNFKVSGSGNLYANIYTNKCEAEISGSGKINLNVNNANSLNAQISGSGDITLNGKTQYSDFDIDGSGSIKAYNLEQQDCYSQITGSGNIYTNVSHYLDVRISGSGNVSYIGHPITNVKITGSGNLNNNNIQYSISNL